MLESLLKSDRVAEKMLSLYNAEASVGMLGHCTVPSPTTPAMLMSVTVSACVTLARTPTPSDVPS